MEYKILAGFIIFVTSIVAIIYPIRARAYPTHHTSLELADAFASGIFLGAALFHMLPEATHEFQQIFGNVDYPWAELFCAIGFLILLFFERLSICSSNTPYVFIFILILHALIEGAALGINTSFAAAFIIFLAIIVHKGSESFALATILNRSHLSLKAILLTITLFSLMTPLGILIGSSLSAVFHGQMGRILTAGFTAFAAGSFLYMSTLHHINHHPQKHARENLWEFGALLTGMIIMAILAKWAH